MGFALQSFSSHRYSRQTNFFTLAPFTARGPKQRLATPPELVCWWHVTTWFDHLNVSIYFFNDWQTILFAKYMYMNWFNLFNAFNNSQFKMKGSLRTKRTFKMSCKKYAWRWQFYWHITQKAWRATCKLRHWHCAVMTCTHADAKINYQKPSQPHTVMKFDNIHITQYSYSACALPHV